MSGNAPVPDADDRAATTQVEEGTEGPTEPLHPKPATPLPEKSGGPSELVRRLFTAVILIPLVLYVILLAEPWVYVAVVAVFSLLAQREFYGLIEDKGAQPLVGLGLALGLAVTLVAYLGNEYYATLLLTISLIVLMFAQVRKREITEAMASISGTFFGVFYVAWLLSHAVVLRFIDASVASRYSSAVAHDLHLAPESGAFFMVYVLSVVIGCDAGAYFAGRAWGRRKLAPQISPNKSVEGAIGGVLFAIVCGAASKAIFDFTLPEASRAFPWVLAVVFALPLSIVGIMGDLVESLLKRDADVKDAGSLLPGMGGVLDRIDAPLLAIPVMYYLLMGFVFFRLSSG